MSGPFATHASSNIVSGSPDPEVPAAPLPRETRVTSRRAGSREAPQQLDADSGAALVRGIHGPVFVCLAEPRIAPAKSVGRLVVEPDGRTGWRTRGDAG